MCGIGAVYNFSVNDPELVRRVVMNLLLKLEMRGQDATGIVAFFDHNRFWLRKAPVPASQFVKDYLSKIRGWEKASIILLHTRAYTTCHPFNNACNHPIWTVHDGRLYALVHNGIVYPGVQELENGGDDLPPVDTSYILRAIVNYCRDILDNPEWLATCIRTRVFKAVHGSMAVLFSNGIYLMAFRRGNPLVYTKVRKNGSMLVLASTRYILSSALEDAGISFADRDVISEIPAEDVYWW